MKKEWIVEVTQVDFISADTEEEAIDKARKIFWEVGSDARFDATEIKSRTSDEQETEA